MEMKQIGMQGLRNLLHDFWLYGHLKSNIYLKRYENLDLLMELYLKNVIELLIDI